MLYTFSGYFLLKHDFTLTFLDLIRACCLPTELGGTWIKGYSDFDHKETGSGGPFRMV